MEEFSVIQCVKMGYQAGLILLSGNLDLMCGKLREICGGKGN
jgi:hypothetical protein